MERFYDGSFKRSAAMPDHKVNLSTSRERRPWWRNWNDYPNPTRDAILARIAAYYCTSNRAQSWSSGKCRSPLSLAFAASFASHQ
jgi:hypothetical protein